MVNLSMGKKILFYPVMYIPHLEKKLRNFAKKYRPQENTCEMTGLS